MLLLISCQPPNTNKIARNIYQAPAAFQEGGGDAFFIRSASSAKSAFQLEMEEMKAREKEVKAGREAAKAAARLQELQDEALRGTLRCVSRPRTLLFI